MVEQFPIVLRGYDKDRVDEAFASAQETVNRLREQVKADDQTILELQAQLQEEKNKKAAPKSFASLGANAQQMLASAEQTSAELLERAKKDASAARATVQLQASTAQDSIRRYLSLCSCITAIKQAIWYGASRAVGDWITAIPQH